MPEHNSTMNDPSPIPVFDPQDILDNAPIGIFTSTPEIAEENDSKSHQTLMTILESLPADVYVSDEP